MEIHTAQEIAMICTSCPTVGYIEKYLKEFAESHVQAALKAASEEVTLTDFANEFLQEGACTAIDKESILLAYPLTNIK